RVFVAHRAVLRLRRIIPFIPPLSVLQPVNDFPPELDSFPTRRSSDLSHSFWRGLSRPLRSSKTAGRCPRRCRKWCFESRWQCFRSEEHTSELQSRFELVCRLLLEKKETTRWSHRCRHRSTARNCRRP